MPDTRTASRPPDTELMEPLDLSALCDGRRTDFPLGIEADAVKVMLNGVYLLLDMDYLLGRKNGQSLLELRRAPSRGASLLVMRVPADERQPARGGPSAIGDLPAYSELPGVVKDNISVDQWPAASHAVVSEGGTVPETTKYVNLKNGQIHGYQMGEAADGPLLAAHDLSGGHGQDDTQFHTSPRGAHGVP